MSTGGDTPDRGGMNDRKDFKMKKERVGGGMSEGPVDEGFAKFLKSLIKERDQLDPDQFPATYRLIQNEIDKFSKGSYNGLNPDPIFIDLYNDPPVTLYARAMPPSRQFPKFNYAGRIIGPKGSYLKALMKETSTKMVLLGKGVMKDKEKEEELRRSNDPKYFHLNEDMHVSVQVTASASEAYKRMAYALNCLKEQVVSDNRTLEGLPWISLVNGHRDPGAGGGRHHDPPPHKYSSGSVSHRSSYPSEVPSRHRAPPPPAAYDYEPASPVYRRSYHHEMSPSPRSADPMKSNYGDPYGGYKAMDSRAPEYADRRGSATSMRGVGGGGGSYGVSRTPPPSRNAYPTAGYDEAYAGYYSTPAADPYYGDGGSYSRIPARGMKTTTTARYAPYKK